MHRIAQWQHAVKQVESETSRITRQQEEKAADFRKAAEANKLIAEHECAELKKQAEAADRDLASRLALIEERARAQEAGVAGETKALLNRTLKEALAVKPSDFTGETMRATLMTTGVSLTPRTAVADQFVIASYADLMALGGWIQRLFQDQRPSEPAHQHSAACEHAEVLTDPPDGLIAQDERALIAAPPGAL